MKITRRGQLENGCIVTGFTIASKEVSCGAFRKIMSQQYNGSYQVILEESG